MGLADDKMVKLECDIIIDMETRFIHRHWVPAMCWLLMEALGDTNKQEMALPLDFGSEQLYVLYSMI